MNSIKLIYYSAIIGFLTVSCGNIKDIEQPPLWTVLLTGNASQNGVGILSSDLAGSGRFSILTSDRMILPAYADVHSDASARVTGDKVWVFSGPGKDSFQEITLSPALITSAEFSFGSGTSPSDGVKGADGYLYTALYNKNYLGVYEPLTGRKVNSLDLSRWADADGIPEAAHLHAEGNRIFITLQRLDRNSSVSVWPPDGVSYLLELSLATMQIQSHTLHGTNPFCPLKKAMLFGEPHLIICSAGYLGYNYRTDGGIEAFNLNTGALTGRFLFAESTADGDILDAVIKNDAEGYAVVEHEDFSVSIQKFNPATGAKISELIYYPSSFGFVSGLLLTSDGLLYAGHASGTEPGIVIFSTAEGDRRLTDAPIPTGLRPVQLLELP